MVRKNVSSLEGTKIKKKKVVHSWTRGTATLSFLGETLRATVSQSFSNNDYRESERDTHTHTHSDSHTHTHTERERERWCLIQRDNVCVCVRERERERERD